MLDLLLNQISDPAVRSNFLKIIEYVRDTSVLQGKFKFFEIQLTQSETGKLIPHGLGFKPKDVIQTYLTGSGSITWNYDDFTDTHLSVTSTDALVVRAFIGRFEETGA